MWKTFAVKRFKGNRILCNFYLQKRDLFVVVNSKNCCAMKGVYGHRKYHLSNVQI